MASRPECRMCGQRVTVGGCKCKGSPTFKITSEVEIKGFDKEKLGV